jgi:hypothetical protein
MERHTLRRDVHQRIGDVGARAQVAMRHQALLRGLKFR